MSDSKVIILNQNLSGGLGNDLVNWSRLFVEAGITTTVVIWKNEGQFKDSLPAGVPKHVIGTGSFLCASWRLSRLLKRNPDACVLATQYKAGASAVFARRLAGTNQRIIYREPVLPESYLNAYTILRYYRLLLIHADCVLAQTGHAGRELSKLGFSPDIIKTCPNLPPRHTSAPRTPGRFSGRAPRLISVGRMTPQKGFARLIQSFPAILARHPGATLTLVGDGPLRGELEALAKAVGHADRITFTGQVADPTAFLKDSDLFVMTSEYEGLSNAFTEALFAGCRAISTPAGGGMADFLCDLGASDCIIDQSFSPSGLADAVDRALSKTQSDWEPAFTRLASAYGHRTVGDIFISAVTRTLSDEPHPDLP